MTNALNQLNAAYDPLQDRILFSMSSQDGSEFRFWITRRYLQLLWTILGRIAGEFAANRAPDLLARDAAAELAHHQANQQSDFKSAWQGGTQHPLGDQPVLLAKITVKKLDANRSALSLLPNEGPGADLGLDERITHVVASLLQRAAIQAEWKLDLAALVPPVSPAAASTRLH